MTPTIQFRQNPIVLALIKELETMPSALGEMPVFHHFSEGLYAREIRVPKDRMIVGRVHSKSHINIISAGRLWVWVEGMGWAEMAAPCTFVAAAGTQKVAITIEDTVWTTIHASQETDIEKLEAELSVPTEKLLLEDQS